MTKDYVFKNTKMCCCWENLTKMAALVFSTGSIGSNTKHHVLKINKQIDKIIAVVVSNAKITSEVLKF